MLKNNNSAPAGDKLSLPKRIKRTARVLILRFRKGKLQFFGLWQQKQGKDSGRLVLPGGQIKIAYAKGGEVKQEKVMEAAIRETCEEIAVSTLNLKTYLGAYSRKMGLKTNQKHTYLFLARIKGKPKVKETETFNAAKNRFYNFETLNKHAHAPICNGSINNTSKANWKNRSTNSSSDRISSKIIRNDRCVWKTSALVKKAPHGCERP